MRAHHSLLACNTLCCYILFHPLVSGCSAHCFPLFISEHLQWKHLSHNFSVLSFFYWLLHILWLFYLHDISWLHFPREMVPSFCLVCVSLLAAIPTVCCAAGAPVAPVSLTSPAKSSGTSSLTNAGEISWTTSISSKLGKISIYIIILIFFVVRERQMHEWLG